MLIMLTDNQLLSPEQVCPNCLWADGQGQPRWDKDQLRCGAPIGCSGDRICKQFRCQMGFRLAQINEMPVTL